MTATDVLEPTANGETTLGLASLSPSRAMDFKACALRYRFRFVDRLPEPTSREAVRGTVVHAVLEQLFDLPPAARTPEAAVALVEPQWRRLCQDDQTVADLFGEDGEETDAWLGSVRDLVTAYFSLEDPRLLRPAERELRVEAELPSGLRLKGYIDRLDRSPGGDLRVVDYKTGRAPDPNYEARALFQLRCYALALWRMTGTLPRVLQLVYLGDRELLRYVPDETGLLATERQLEALGQTIRRAGQTGDWRHRPSRLCDWCHFHQLCPAFGGLPPAPRMPSDMVAANA